MKKRFLAFLLLVVIESVNNDLLAQLPALTHPNTGEQGWVELFKSDLSNAIFPKGVWTYSDGIFTASKDETLWSDKKYDDFILDLEFRNAKGTNSGVFVHGSDLENSTENSVEVQITDDYDKEWADSPPDWQCAAIFGHQPPTKHIVKKPGEWNHYTITCIGRKIWVVLNNELVNECDMTLYTSAKKNPDGTEIPEWLSKPLADIVLKGHIGFQGKHGNAPIYFRNIRIKELH